MCKWRQCVAGVQGPLDICVHGRGPPGGSSGCSVPAIPS